MRKNKFMPGAFLPLMLLGFYLGGFSLPFAEHPERYQENFLRIILQSIFYSGVVSLPFVSANYRNNVSNNSVWIVIFGLFLLLFLTGSAIYSTFLFVSLIFIQFCAFFALHKIFKKDRREKTGFWKWFRCFVLIIVFFAGFVGYMIAIFTAAGWSS